VQPTRTNEDLWASAGSRTPRQAACAHRAARPGRRQLEPCACPVNVQERSYNKYRPAQTQPKPFLLRLMSNPPANVKSTANLFHKQFVMKVDGKIEGSPLYASAVAIAGGIHNVLYVAPCTTPSLPSMPIPAAAFRAMAWHSHHRI